MINHILKKISVILLILVVFIAIVPMKINAETWQGVVNYVDIVADFGIEPNLDNIYIKLAYGGITSDGYYKFVIYYEVTDKDGDSVDDEHVIFRTKWYYALIGGSGGGGGGGHALPMDSNQIFSYLTMHEWRPEEHDEGYPTSVSVGIDGLSVSFTLMRLGGWDVTRKYSSNSMGPVCWLNQTSGWLIGSDYGYRNGANSVTTEPNKNINGLIYGIKVYFNVTIMVDADDLPGGYGGSLAWYYPAGTLAYS